MLESLGVDLKTIIFSMVNFLILVAVLGKFIYKPFLGMLEQRKNAIQEQFDKAEVLNSRANAKMAKYNRQIANAEEEARDILKDAKERAEKMSEDIIAEAKQQASEIIEHAHKTIENEKAQAVDDLKDEIAQLALLAAEKIVGGEIDNVGHDAIVERVIKNSRSSEWQN
ncbi:MAG: F0F1 ATP synthase subunit B [Firmicutes bacterium]|nr:F0F1 ATP synthase subunit B [Bacillota bacterium]